MKQQPKLYIRACYPKLFEKLQQYERVLLTGTPGIGKVGKVGLARSNWTVPDSLTLWQR